MSVKTLPCIAEIETFYGMVENTKDALCIFEMCRQGKLGRVRRRLHERERMMIRSGSVFVFDEQESGIKRWTDGKLWSPSRIFGNFLIYRELEKKIPKVVGEDTPLNNTYTSIEDASPVDALDIESFNQWWSNAETEPKKRLLTNHTGQYIFTHQGLIKKTISASIDGHIYHLVCYYSAQDFCCKNSQKFDPELRVEMQRTLIPTDLLLEQNFRRPEIVSSLPEDFSSSSKRRKIAKDCNALGHTAPRRYFKTSNLTPITPILPLIPIVQPQTNHPYKFDHTTTLFLSTPPLPSPNSTCHKIDHEYTFDYIGIDFDLPFVSHHNLFPHIPFSNNNHRHYPFQTTRLNDDLQFEWDTIGLQ